MAKRSAIALATEGAKVVIAARRAERLNAVAERIEASGGKALPIVTDVTNETQVNDLVRQAIAQLGRIDIVVNNAGIALLGLSGYGNQQPYHRQSCQTTY